MSSTTRMKAVQCAEVAGLYRRRRRGPIRHERAERRPRCRPRPLRPPRSSGASGQLLTSARPMPSPRVTGACPLPPCRNGSKTDGRNSGTIPGPCRMWTSPGAFGGERDGDRAAGGRDFSALSRMFLKAAAGDRRPRARRQPGRVDEPSATSFFGAVSATASSRADHVAERMDIQRAPASRGVQLEQVSTSLTWRRALRSITSAAGIGSGRFPS